MRDFFTISPSTNWSPVAAKHKLTVNAESKFVRRSDCTYGVGRSRRLVLVN